VSGEPIVLAGDVNGTAARLVETIARLAELNLGPYALVGGLAVMCRLAAVHRATQDIDTVTEATVPTAIEVITSSIGAVDPTNPNRVLIDGVRVDVIDTESFRYDDLDGVELADRLFVVSHRWALESATETEITAGTATAHLRVATVAALVAMKTGALFGGRHREPRKRASDLYDLYRLVLEHDRAGETTAALAAAPFGLGHLVADALRASVLDEPERALRQLRDGGPEASRLSVDDLQDLLTPLVEHLSR